MVSLVVAEEIWRLADLQSVPEPPWNLVRPAFQEASGIVAFDTWIGNTDRNNSKNILFFPSQTGRGYQAVFIDHAFSLNRDNRWVDGAWEDVSVPAMPTEMRESTRGAPIAGAVERIEDLGVEIVEDVVTRIPDEFMTEAHREVVLEGLTRRKDLVRSALDGAYDL